MSCHRSPNLPLATAITFDPGRAREICDASNAVVPEPAMLSTGPLVRYSRCNRSERSLKIAWNCLVR